jgi:hypothetical protein
MTSASDPRANPGLDNARGRTFSNHQPFSFACGLLPGHWIEPSMPGRGLPVAPPELLDAGCEVAQGAAQA